MIVNKRNQMTLGVTINAHNQDIIHMIYHKTLKQTIHYRKCHL